jgi:uncharacterized protein YaiI (UPF0178 family)
VASYARRLLDHMGLHPADVEKLLAQLDGLLAAGNTVVLMEHDMQVVAASDWVIDLGSGAGDEGGRVVRAARLRRWRALPGAAPRRSSPRSCRSAGRRRGRTSPMKIWVDADACPGAVRDIVIRAAQRVRVATVFVANKRLHLPVSEYLSTVQVGAGLDVADRYIEAHAQQGDLAITQDIPLAAALVPRGVCVMDVRGELFSEENVAERLSVRNFMQELRESGVTTGGPAGFSAQDKQQFASTLDRELTRLLKGQGGA